MKRSLSVMLCFCIAFTMIGPSAKTVMGETSFTTQEGLVINKSISKNETDENYTITLEAYAEGELNTFIKGNSIPTDIVLVLDQSGSMEYAAGNGILVENADVSMERGYYVFKSGIHEYETRYNSTKNKWEYNLAINNWIELNDNSELYMRRINILKNIVTDFVNDVKQKASDAVVDHRIAMVGFANGNLSYQSNVPYYNTELLIGDSEYAYLNASSQYQNAFQSVNTASGFQNLQDSIGKLSAQGPTYMQYGLDMANGLFGANVIDETIRNRVVVVFTDGDPGPSKLDDETVDAPGGFKFDDVTANATILKAFETKNTYHSNVYTVGLFDDANPTDNGELNQLMNYISSNYENAQGMKNTGTKTVGGNYYLTIKNVETDLPKLFQTFSETITSGGSKIELDDTAVVKDIISDDFELPAGTLASDIKVYTQSYIGQNTWGPETPMVNPIINIVGRNVSVSNFNFMENWVGNIVSSGTVTGKHGEKLVIKIPVRVNDTTFGGANIPTNSLGSGIYDSKGTFLAEFISPKVDIPIRYNYSVLDAYTYLNDKVDLSKTLSTMAGYEPNGSNNAHVIIEYKFENGLTYTVPAGEKYVDGVWTNLVDGGCQITLTDDMKMPITCTITSISQSESNQDANLKIINKVINLYAYKPIVSFTDLTVDYGTTINLDDRATVAWKASDGMVPVDLSKAPTLEFSYSPTKNIVETVDNPTIYDVSNFTVTKVMQGTSDITTKTTFVAAICNNDSENHLAGRHFTIHLNYFDLILKKNIANTSDSAFLFTVKYNENGVNQIINVVISPLDFSNGTAEKKIVQLKRGNTYTVEEQIEWSWRFGKDKTTVSVDNQDSVLSTEATLVSTSSEHRVTFTNEVTNNKWLSGDSFIRNIFKP